MGEVEVGIQWCWIELETTDTWSVVLKKLKAVGLKKQHLNRTVYAIRIKARFAISYPKDVSPTLYVGEGYLKQRVDAHRKWLANFEQAFGPVKLELAVSTPRVKNNKLAYKETEAALLQFFFKKYGALPFKNSHLETQKFRHSYKHKDLAVALTPGSGTKYQWAIQPTKINPFYEVFKKHNNA